MQGKHTRAGGEIPLRTHPVAQGGVGPHDLRTDQRSVSAAARWAAVILLALGIPALIVIAAVTALTGYFDSFQGYIRQTEENLVVPAALVAVTAFVSGLYASLRP